MKKILIFCFRVCYETAPSRVYLKNNFGDLSKCLYFRCVNISNCAYF